MRYLTYILFLFLFLVQCNTVSKKESGVVESDLIVEPDTLPPLEVGEVFYKGDQPFGEIIELKGRQITGDTAIFKAGPFIIRDSLAVMSHGFYYPLTLFSYPDLKCIGEVGKCGNGPDEYILPMLIETVDTNAVCYVVDEGNYNKYLRLTKDLRLESIPTQLKGEAYMIYNITHIGNGECFYVEKSNSGVSIMHSIVMGDSVIPNEVYDLRFRKEQKFWGTYLGALGVNVSKNRLVYAYNYYRMIKFMDLEGKQVRTVKFLDEKEYDDATENMADGLDRNVTHYGKICVGEKYVYIVYSGMTPIDKIRLRRKTGPFMYIEKYDWNGNPICKYKLDQEIYMAVDEANHKLYIASRFHDDPFFVYDLPE